MCSGNWTKLNVNGSITPRSSSSACIYKDRYIIIIGGEKNSLNNGLIKNYRIK